MRRSGGGVVLSCDEGRGVPGSEGVVVSCDEERGVQGCVWGQLSVMGVRRAGVEGVGVGVSRDGGEACERSRGLGK